jgi:transcription termination factor Rho
VRLIGRAVGVSSPTNKKKEELIEDILNIASNQAQPCSKTLRGAPPKTSEYDHSLVEEIENCREQYMAISSINKGDNYQPNMEQLIDIKRPVGIKSTEARNDNGLPPQDDNTAEGQMPEEIYSGVLEYTDKFWFLRTSNLQVSSTNDVFIHLSFVNRFKLRVGDYIVCKAKRRKENECAGITYIVSINGYAPDDIKRRNFEGLLPCYPDKRFNLEYEGCSLTERVIDLFSPIGFGQRALIVSPPKVGKTTMLKHIASAITRNYPKTKVMILLIDERPEEVTDIKRSVKGAQVFYSTFDKGDIHHIHTATLGLEYAKRLVEVGENVVILIDSITRLTRAYNSICNSGRTLSGGLDPQAIVEPKKFFGAARNTEEGGSLTIIGTVLVDTGSRLDDVIYEEFKSTGNMEIELSRDLAERRIFPAIDIKASGARREELLLTEKELNAVTRLRGLIGKEMSTEQLYDTISKTNNNDEFCEKAQTFLKVYRNDR